jgi:hypothetical protein
MTEETVEGVCLGSTIKEASPSIVDEKGDLLSQPSISEEPFVEDYFL